MDWKDRKPVFGQEEVKEIQTAMLSTLDITHKRLYDILDKYTKSKDIKLDLISLLEFIFDDMQMLKKDINIEAITDQSKLASK